MKFPYKLTYKPSKSAPTYTAVMTLGYWKDSLEVYVYKGKITVLDLVSKYKYYFDALTYDKKDDLKYKKYCKETLKEVADDHWKKNKVSVSFSPEGTVRVTTTDTPTPANKIKFDGTNDFIPKGAIRYDSGKPRYSLIPPEALHALSVILTKGMEKYDKRNWEKGMDWSRCFDSLQRHLWAWWGREDKDAESKESHLWSALANIVFLLTYEQRKIGKDDRGA